MSTSAHRRDPHLGGLVAAVVDGALDHDARDRALAHLARCDACRAEVEAQRRIKVQLARMSAPELPGGLAERLLRVPDAMPAPSVGTVTADPALPPVRMVASFRSRGPAGRPAANVARPGQRPASRRPGRGPGRSSARRRVAGAAAGGLAAFVLSLATVVALGSPDRPQRIVPAIDSYTVEHNWTAGGVPGSDPAVETVGVSTSGVR